MPKAAWKLTKWFLITDSIIDIEHSDSVYDKMADIYAIGFQEIVDLNAGNIMAASSENAKACEFQLLSSTTKFRTKI